MISTSIAQWTFDFREHHFSATAPCSMYSILLENKVIDDPYYRTNEHTAKLLSNEDCEMATSFTVTEEMLSAAGGNSMSLKVGENIPFQDLLKGLVVQNANDAALVLASVVGGNITSFVEKMNEKAAELGLSDTHFENPHGLDAEDHYTTAKDLARLGAAAIQNETVRKIASTYKITIGEGESARLIVNHNKLLRSYDGAIGLKTGFTKKCGRCLVGAAERDGVTLVTATLSAPDDWADHRRMLDFGFEALTAYARLLPEEFTREISVLGGEKSTVTVYNREGFSLVERAGLGEVTMRLSLNPTAAAPIAEGDVLGKILFLRDGEMLGSLDLVAKESISAAKQRRKKFFFF